MCNRTYWKAVDVCFDSKAQQHKLAKYCDDMLEDYLLKRCLDNVPVCHWYTNSEHVKTR